MLRNRILIVLVVAVVIGLIASCAPAATQTPGSQTREPSRPTMAPTTTPSTPSEPAKTYKVALVIAMLGDRSFLDSAARGIGWAEERLPNVETRIIQNADLGEQALAARAMAEEGYDLVITIGFDAADWTAEIANEYPDTHFALIESPLNVPNGTGLIFREHEGTFTVGMDNPSLRRFQEGYIQGVKYADPSVEVVSGWVGSYQDPTKAKELALIQYEEGVDIIFAAAGKSGEGVIAASAERGLYSIGVDSDQCWIQPGNVICSMMKMVDVSVFDAIQSLTEGTLEAGNRVYGLEQDAVGMCYLYDIDSEFLDHGPPDMAAKMRNEVIPAVEEAVRKIKAGEMCVTDHMGVYPCDNPAQPGGMGV
jgi:basic membrane protein A